MMLRMVNDKNLMGEHTNGLVLNIVTYLTVILLILMTLGSIVLTLVAGVGRSPSAGRAPSAVRERMLVLRPATERG